MNNNDLDQFYTNPLISDQCVKIMDDYLRENDINNFIFLEPSAGTGNFVRSIKKYYGDSKKVVAVDIDPKDKDIMKDDFFKTSFKSLGINKKDNVIVIGNPPFGKRSKKAIEFINHSLNYSKIIGFIVPLQFQKWSVQSKLNKDLKLVFSQQLEPKSFIVNDKDYSVRCCFQIWVTKEMDGLDKRIKTAPKTSHKDFEMFLYNNTPETYKYFDKDKYQWDFAVPRQGYYDYSSKIYNANDLNKRVQWMFFKAKNKKILTRLKNIDFKKLSLGNTTVPGFGKADVILEYISKYGDN